MSTFLNNWLERRAMSGDKEIVPGSDGYNYLYFETATVNQTILIFYFPQNIDGQVIVDDNLVDVSAYGNDTFRYTFPEPGIHLVKYKELNGVFERRFEGCKNLVEAYLLGGVSGGLTYYVGYFGECSSLRKVVFLNPTTISTSMFGNCTSYTDISFDNITGIRGSGRIGNYNIFRNVSFPDLTSYGMGVASVTGAFENSSSIQIVDFGKNISDISGTLLYASSCKVLIIRATAVPSGSFVYGWNQADAKIYVPYSQDHSVLNSYKNASNFSAKASIIFELNPDGTVPTS